MKAPVDFQTLYQCPFCLSTDIVVKKPHCYCRDCERSFDTDEALIPEDEK